jgi:polyhydroxyalkanoate synthesis regulator phasin
MAAGAKDNQVQRLADQLVAEKQINTERAKQLLAEMN